MKIEEIGNVVFIKKEHNSKWAVMFNKKGFFDMVESMYTEMDAGPGPFLTVNGELKVWYLSPDKNIEDVATEFEFDSLSDAAKTFADFCGELQGEVRHGKTI